MFGLSELETLRVLFTFAFILWVFSAVLFARRYAETLAKTGWHHPFIVSSVWLAVSNLLECTAYVYVLWFTPENRELSTWALRLVPVSISTQAVAYMIVAHWVMNRGGDNGHTRY